MHDTTSRFNWRMRPRPTTLPEKPAPHIPEPSNLAKWFDQKPLAYVEGMNAYVFQAANPINAVNPLGE
jgi:hypothetical protein